MAAAGADEAARPAQPDQRRAALLLGAEGLPKPLVAQTTHARCNLEPHNRDPLIQNILRTYIPTGGVSRISRMPFVVDRALLVLLHAQGREHGDPGADAERPGSWPQGSPRPSAVSPASPVRRGHPPMTDGPRSGRKAIGRAHPPRFPGPSQSVWRTVCTKWLHSLYILTLNTAKMACRYRCERDFRISPPQLSNVAGRYSGFTHA